MEDFITITVVTAKLKKEVQEKLMKMNSGSEFVDSKKDSLGRTAEFYHELGIDVPEELQSEEGVKTFDIKKEHYDIVEKSGKIKPSVIDFMVDNEDFGCILYVDTDFTITVKETVEEIENKIKLLKDGVK
jgi:hypothetical protein